MSNIVFLAERWPFAGPSTNRWPHNLLKNKYLLIMWRSLSPAKSQNSTVPLRNLLGWLDLSAFPEGFGIPGPKAQKPAAPSFAEEIHLSTEVTCCFWPCPHSFLRCSRPARSRILSCDRTVPWMYVRTPRNFRGGYL